MRAIAAAISAIILAALCAPATRAECLVPEAAPAAAPHVSLPSSARPDAPSVIGTHPADTHVAARLVPVRPPAGTRLADETVSTHAPSPLTLTDPNPYEPYTRSANPGTSRTPLRPEDVADRLRARGFVRVSEVRQRGRAFLAEATGPRGERVRLVVDAASGEISGMQVIGFDRAR